MAGVDRWNKDRPTRPDFSGEDIYTQLEQASKLVGRSELASLAEANFSGGKFVGTEFDGMFGEGLDFTRANFAGADLRKVVFGNAKLVEADFVRGADLNNADLSRVSLHRADLRAADMRCADLSRADLCGASFTGTDLRDANLSGGEACRCGPLLGFAGRSEPSTARNRGCPDFSLPTRPAYEAPTTWLARLKSRPSGR